ncbi:hypothetical protein ABTC74_19995, partial [Acinetobacter baumannii]
PTPRDVATAARGHPTGGAQRRTDTPSKRVDWLAAVLAGANTRIIEETMVEWPERGLAIDIGIA